MSLFLNEATGIHPEFFFKKKGSVHVFSCQVHVPNILEHLSCKTRPGDWTASAKYPFVFHVNLSHKMLPLILFFPFYFKYFQSKPFSSLKILKN